MKIILLIILDKNGNELGTLSEHTIIIELYEFSVTLRVPLSKTDGFDAPILKRF